MEDWNFAELLSLVLSQKPRTEFAPRERLWASELYNAPIDLYLKLRGTNPSNVPDFRAMAKFEGGNQTETIVRTMLVLMGIFQKSQTRVGFEREGLLPVSGKVDFEAGGIPTPPPDYFFEFLELLGYSDDFIERAKQASKVIIERFPNGLTHKVIELKSVATHGMNRILLSKQALEGHDLQAFHYAYNTGKVVELLYVCRDDWRMWSIPIYPDDKVLLEKYLSKIQEITKNHMSETPPPKEKLVIYDDAVGKFARNFSVQYSSYLTMLYGFKHAEEYADWFKSTTKGWNAAIGWIAKGKRITPKKEIALKQIEAFGFNVELIKKNVIELAAKGLVPEEEAEESEN